MKQYLLDTSVIIAYLRHKPGITEYISGLDAILTTSYVCVAELYEGVNRVIDKKTAETGVLDFCSGLSEIYGLDLETAMKFGEIKAELQSKGQVIDDIDILIAATCLVHNLTLFTLNLKHFVNIENLQVQSPSSS